MQIHHSSDLINWRSADPAAAARQPAQYAGGSYSCGIWAPCLSYDGGFLPDLYRCEALWPDLGRRRDGRVAARFSQLSGTATTIDGEWSDPVYLNSSGFDPSLFHDDDGNKWLVNMLWDHRPGQNRFAGIVVQEYSPREKKLIGERVNIFEGTPLGLTEAPHLYKRDGWYYLLTAEGGTGWSHAVTMARSAIAADPTNCIPTPS